MNERFIESRKVIANAREALKRGDMTQARQLAERAAELAPHPHALAFARKSVAERAPTSTGPARRRAAAGGARHPGPAVIGALPWIR